MAVLGGRGVSHERGTPVPGGRICSGRPRLPRSPRDAAQSRSRHSLRYIVQVIYTHNLNTYIYIYIYIYKYIYLYIYIWHIYMQILYHIYTLYLAVVSVVAGLALFARRETPLDHVGHVFRGWIDGRVWDVHRFVERRPSTNRWTRPVIREGTWRLYL